VSKSFHCIVPTKHEVYEVIRKVEGEGAALHTFMRVWNSTFATSISSYYNVYDDETKIYLRRQVFGGGGVRGGWVQREGASY